MDLVAISYCIEAVMRIRRNDTAFTIEYDFRKKMKSMEGIEDWISIRRVVIRRHNTAAVFSCFFCQVASQDETSNASSRAELNSYLEHSRSQSSPSAYEATIQLILQQHGTTSSIR